MVRGLAYNQLQSLDRDVWSLCIIWNEQKLSRKHTKGLGMLPVFREGIPSSLGHAANEGERIFGSGPFVLYKKGLFWLCLP